MPLSSGLRLGPYEILAPLGAGGMGEVYRARDVDLKREVAIKVLPLGVADDADRLNRFRREAELLAALNHSHVAQIYGLTKTPDGAPALVMELVEGATLAERLARDPLPPDRAVALAMQIADGLDAAHEAGVVHRDLKPANIKVRPDGTVKLLDFGLARSTTAPPHDTHTPTVLSPAVTQPGLVLGTAAYMSPEQARGQLADARSDIWSFGCVLFEMLTGRPAFPGGTVADLIANILDREPDWTALPTACGEDIRRVLRRCLAKDRRQRYGAIADVRFDLLEASLTVSATPKGISSSHPRWQTWVAAAAGALAATAASFALRPQAPPPTIDRVTTATVLANAGQLNLGHGGLQITPDERSIYMDVIAASRRDTQIWRRSLDEIEATPIQGTEGGRGSSISRDGSWLAFTAGGKLLKVPAGGGAPTVLADAPHLHGAAWSLDGATIYYAPSSSGAIWSVPSAGGEPKAVTTLNRQAGDIAHEWPVVAPDGRLVYVRNGQRRPFDGSDVVAHDLKTGRSRVLVRNALGPRFDNAGHPFFLDRNGSVSVAGLTAAGEAAEPSPITRLRPWMISGTAAYDVSASGLVAYAPEVDRSQRTIVARDRSGNIEEWSPKRAFMSIATTADGKRLAASLVGGILLVGTSGMQDWTQLPQTAFTPALLWTASGQQLTFAPSLGRLATLTAAGGVAEAEVVAADFLSLTPLTWHPSTGRMLLRKSGALGLWSWDAERTHLEPLATFERTPVLHAATEARLGLIAVSTDFTGLSVRPLEVAEPTVRVSGDGIAMEPHWSADGTRLYYSVGRTIEVAAISANPLSVGGKQAVGIADKVTGAGNIQTFAVLPDDRIVYIREGDSQPRDRLFIRQDWRSLLGPGSASADK